MGSTAGKFGMMVLAVVVGTIVAGLVGGWINKLTAVKK